MVTETEHTVSFNNERPEMLQKSHVLVKAESNEGAQNERDEGAR
jgi:hypothetical protein